MSTLGYTALPTAVLAAGVLKSNEIAVLLAIRSFDWGKHGNGCTASKAKIATRAGCDERTVYRTVKRLVHDHKVVTEEHRKDAEGRDLATVLRINELALQRLASGSDTVSDRHDTVSPRVCQNVGHGSDTLSDKEDESEKDEWKKPRARARERPIVVGSDCERNGEHFFFCDCPDVAA